MLSLDETFDALRGMLQAPDALNPARADPLFYFLHRPEETLAVAQKLPIWTAALETQGLTVEPGVAGRHTPRADRRVRSMGPVGRAREPGETGGREQLGAQRAADG